MEIIRLKRTKRQAIPYIVNLKCECGGNFIANKPLVIDYNTNTIVHTCDKCGKVVNADDTYPTYFNYTNAPEEDFDTVTALEGVVNTILA